MTSSPADYFRSLPVQERERRLRKLTAEQRRRLPFDWHFWARPEQLPPPGAWTYWLIQAGRGFGKTRTGAEWVRRKVRTTSRVSLIAPTAGDVRDVMVEGESGILRCCPKSERPEYEPSNRKLIWPNGAISNLFSADEPDRLRGPQHGAIWADELAAWRYAESWDQAQFGLRLGTNPQACVTTTPRPLPIIRELAADPGCIVSRGTTRANAHNLAPVFLTKIVGKYAGTRLGRQELDGEILDDNPGALWQRSQLDLTRVKVAPSLQRIVVAIDPSGTANKPGGTTVAATARVSDECGILAAGLGDDGDVYVLEDVSEILKPDAWGARAVQLYRRLEADRIVAEVNYGGDMVESVIRAQDPNVPYSAVHASRGKALRAEPVAALYEQGRVHHVGFFAKLEDELCDWDPTGGQRSPNRLDALVWAVTALALGESTTALLDWLRSQPAADKPKAENAVETGQSTGWHLD